MKRSCDCKAEYHLIHGNDSVSVPIEYCATHEAAFRMKAALLSLQLNMANDRFVDPMKREMYMAVIDQALSGGAR